MAKLNCICGAQLSNVQCPNQTEGLLLRDVDMGDLDGKDSLAIADIGRGVWECYSCGRLAVNYPGRGNSTVKWYRPEDGTPGALMAFDKPNNQAQTRAPGSAGSMPEPDALTCYIIRSASIYTVGQWDVPKDMIRGAGIKRHEIEAVLPPGPARDRVLSLLKPNT